MGKTRIWNQLNIGDIFCVSTKNEDILWNTVTFESLVVLFKQGESGNKQK